MKRFWASWWSGNYESEGCTKPPFKFWVSGQRDRLNYGLTASQLTKLNSFKSETAYDNYLNKHAKDDCSICAVIDAEDEEAVAVIVTKHFPDAEMRFCEERPADFKPGDRFL